MPWPTPQDYNEAVQNARLAFNDPELQAALPKLSPLGFPQPNSGSFANTYKMESKQGQTWAVRCFLREFGDQQVRYEAISRELARLNLPYTVKFCYQPAGILVRGNRYPILKMEWVQGESLSRYVENRIGQQSLRNLAEKILTMAKQLSDAGIAHGDLQHGNIMVLGEEPRLIDYDGMFVPSLAGLGSNEAGHPNFQHIRRTGAEFGPGLDNFSVWVIYLSLLAVSEDPGLWSRHKGGDECLLFRRADFERPEKSKLFNELDRSGDQVVKVLAGAFRSVLCLNPLQIPLIDRHGTRTTTSTTSRSNRLNPPIPGNQLHLDKSLPDWMRDTVTSTPNQQTLESLVDIDWLMETWTKDSEAVADLEFTNSRWPDRITGALALMSLLFVGVMHLRGLPAYSGPMMATGILTAFITFSLSRKSNDLGALNLRERIRQEAEATANAEKAGHNVRDLDAQLKEMLDGLDQRERMLRAKIAAIQNLQKCELSASKFNLTSQKSRLQRGRDQARQELDDGLRLVRDKVSRFVNDIDQQISVLPASEAAEQSKALQQMQNDHIQSLLRSARLENAHIHDIGPMRKARLIQRGFITAADIKWAVTRVDQIGTTRGRALLAWRESIVTQAERTKPNTLPQVMLQMIRERFEAQRSSLLQEKAKIQSSLTLEEQSLQTTYTRNIIQLNEEERATDQEAENRERKILNQAQTEIAETETKLEQVRKEHQSLATTQARKRCAEARQNQASANWIKARLKHQVARGRPGLTYRGYISRVWGFLNPILPSS